MDMTFLRELQQRGWEIEAVSGDACIVRCPEVGCETRLKLRPGGPLPSRSASDWKPGVSIEEYADALALLILRRKQLRLRIDEVEDVAGLTQDHISKFEQKTRVPNVETFLIWLETLGYEMILRSRDLPAPTLRAISQTRHLEASRARRFARPPRKLPRRLALPAPD